jgi:hypothetical protein
MIGHHGEEMEYNNTLHIINYFMIKYKIKFFYSLFIIINSRKKRNFFEFKKNLITFLHCYLKSSLSMSGG